MRQIFGEKDDYEDFFKQNRNLRGREFIEVYALEHQIDPTYVKDKINTLKKEKLAAFYDKPESEFDSIVEENDFMNFREIISLLRDQGYDYNGENFKQMRNKLKEGRSHQKGEKHLKNGS